MNLTRLLGVSAFLCLPLVGCGSSSDENKGTTDTPDSSTVPVEDGATGEDVVPGEDAIADGPASDVVYPPPGSEWPEPDPGPVDTEPAPDPETEAILDVTSPAKFYSPDVTITGSVTDPALFASGTWSLDGAAPEALVVDADGNFTFPATLTPGWHTLRLVALTAANETRASVEYVGYDTKEPSSFDKIEAAVANGTIDEEMALVFKVYALHHDQKLPDEYRGFDAMAEMSHVMTSVTQRFDTLSSTAQQKLEPFLMPAFYKGSWWGLAHGALRDDCPPTRMFGCMDACMSLDWEYQDGEFIRVWSRKGATGDKTNAKALIATVEGKGNAWSKLYGLLGRVPGNDEAFSCNGGNGKLDITILPMPADGITKARLGGYPTPTFIEVSSQLSLPRLQGAVTHELMHAFQYAQKLGAGDMDSYKMLSESTATWAVDFVWRKANQWEHMYAVDYIHTVGRSLTDHDPPLRTYGAYVFPMFLERNGLGPDVVAQMWKQAETVNEKESIVNAVSAKGSTFPEQWRKFAAAFWNNNGERGGKFATWDNLRNVTSNPEELALGGPDDETKLPSELEPISLRYYAFNLGADSGIHSMAFLNGLTNRMKREEVMSATLPLYSKADVLYKPTSQDIPKYLGAQVITRRNGKWSEPVDLTSAWPSYKTWCRDTEADRIDALAIVFSYSDHTASSQFKEDGDQSGLILSNMVCDDANVSADMMRNLDQPQGNLTVNGKIGRFGDVVQNWGSGGKALLGFELRPLSGTMKHLISGPNGDCLTESEWSGAFGSGTGNSLYSLSFVRGTQSHSYLYWGLPADSLSTSVTAHCPEGDKSWPISVGQYWKFAAITEAGNYVKAETNGDYKNDAKTSFGNDQSSGSWSIIGTHSGI